MDVVIGFVGVMAVWFVGYCFLAPKDVADLVRRLISKLEG